MAAQWWVIKAYASSVPVYQVIQNAAKPDARLVETANGTTVTVTGPFATQAAAKASLPAGAKMSAGGPNGPNGSSPSPSVNVPGAISSVEQFLSILTERNLWVRVAKVAVGGALLIIGLAKMTGADRKIEMLGNIAAKAPLI